MKKHKRDRNNAPFSSTMIFGITLSFFLILALSLICSLILIATKDPGGKCNVASLSVFLISALIAGYTISKYKRDGGIKAALLSSLVIVLSVILVSLIANRGTVLPKTLMNCLCYLLASLLSAFVAKSRASTRRKRR